jgi:hypothetical protein
MADQSSARPKWIPNYISREANGKQHITKWSSIFEKDLSKDDFCKKLADLEFQPPLGGPYLSATAASIEDFSAAERLFDVLAKGKETLTQKRMSKRLLKLANGEEGLTWATFLSCISGS